MSYCSPVKAYRVLLAPLLLLTLSTCARAPFPPNVKAKLGEVHYSPAVGGVLGSEEPTFELLLSEATPLVTIRVGLTPDPNFRVVKVIEFKTLRTADNYRTDYVGSPEGDTDWQPVITVPAGHTVRGISGRGGWFIDAISFHFTDGSRSPEFGGAGGDTDFRILLAETPLGQPRGRLLGFYGTAGGLVESLGLVFWPVE